MTGKCGRSAGYHAHRRRKEPICDRCQVAYRRFCRDYRKRAYLQGPTLVDATGTRRRIQALMRLGWSQTAIGAELGVLNRQVSQMTRSKTVHAATARKVLAVYDRLSMTIGGSEVARTYAIKRGWPPPLDFEGRDIDDPKVLSHSQHGALVREGHARRKAAA